MVVSAENAQICESGSQGFIEIERLHEVLRYCLVNCLNVD
jgi:hypothetical protein